MIILSVNAGSSTLKWTIFDMPEEKVLASGNFEKIGLSDSFYTIKLNGEKIVKEVLLNNHSDAVKVLVEELIAYKIINKLEDIDGVGHRVVHGGDKYSDSILINEDVIKTIDDLCPLAPLHNPANLIGINSFKEVIKGIKSVAVFDTAFHQTMDKAAYIYAVPYDWYTEYGIRRYGFHGTSHKYITHKLMEKLNNPNLKIISCHLGNGGSISAVDSGRCIDTTLGFTPLPGIPMGTRSGDIDPGIIPYIMEKAGKTISEVMEDLNKRSGFLGVSGFSSDNREIEAGVAEGNERCQLATDIYVRKIVGYIANYYVLLNGADVIIFSGGIGENGPLIREAVMEKLGSLGVFIDHDANDVKGVFRKISSEESSVDCYIVPTNEELMIAKDTYDILK